jgi:hypothetical protein
MKTAKRIAGALILADLLAFLILFGIAAFRSHADLVIPSLAISWELSEAGLSLIEWLPALHFLALALALGTVRDKAENILRSGALPAILLSALFATAGLLLAPRLETTRSSVLASSARFNSSLASTRSALDRGQPAEARAAFGAAEAISPHDPRTDELRDRLLGAEARAERQTTEAKEGPEEKPRPDPKAAAKEFEAAAGYFRQKDFYSAHWHAARAAELDPSRADAAKLAAQAWGEILALGESAEDSRRAAFFARKVDAFARLKSGDSVGAFRLFSELSAEEPGDIDAARYLAESLAAVNRDAFFKDEADSAAKGLCLEGFLLPRLGLKDGSARLEAREIAFGSAAAYLFDAVYTERAADGSQQLKVTSPYAKLAGGRLYFESVEREKPSRVYLPRIEGRPGPGGDIPLSVEAGVDLIAAYRLTAGRKLPASLGADELFAGAKVAPAYGIPASPFIAELLRRLGLPFMLFGATVLGALVGIRFRVKEGKPSLLSWFALPYMVAVTALYFIFASAMDAALSAWVMRLLPGTKALVASACLRALLIALLLVFVAGLSRNDADASEEDRY